MKAWLTGELTVTLATSAAHAHGPGPLSRLLGRELGTGSRP
jgi:hypothetical protein